MSMKCLASDLRNEWPEGAEQSNNVLDTVQLPTELHLLEEIGQLADLANFSKSTDPGEKSDIDFALEQQVLSVSLTEINQDWGKTIYTTLKKININNEEIFVKLMPARADNAFVLYNYSCDNMVLGLNSRILDSYQLNEIGFIIGHELGHHHLFHTREPYKKALKYVHSKHPISQKALAISRRNEISADRFGLLLCGADLKTAVSTIRKITLQAVGKNLESDPKEQTLYKFYDAELDGYVPWEHSHPHMAIRLKAITAWVPIAQRLLCKKSICPKTLRTINDYCETLLTGMDHDDCKNKYLLDEFGHALRIIDCYLRGKTENALFQEASSNMASKDESGKYADAVRYLRTVASPGKKLRILDWLASRMLLASNPPEVRNTLLPLAEEFGVLPRYTKRAAKMAAYTTFLTNQLK